MRTDASLEGMRLRDFLCIPYRLHAEAVEREDGAWIRRLRYPELGDFYTESIDVEAALVALERQRFLEILRLVESGQRPPVPRSPVSVCDPAWLAAELGIAARIHPHIDKCWADFATPAREPLK